MSRAAHSGPLLVCSTRNFGAYLLRSCSVSERLVDSSRSLAAHPPTRSAIRDFVLLDSYRPPLARDALSLNRVLASEVSALQFSFRLEPIIQIAVRLFATLQKNLVRAKSNLLIRHWIADLSRNRFGFCL